MCLSACNSKGNFYHFNQGEYTFKSDWVHVPAARTAGIRRTHRNFMAPEDKKRL